MPRRRFIPRVTSYAQSIPFMDAEEAWFWYVRSQQARDEGARFASAASVARPCDPDDLYRAVMGLVRNRRLDNEHIKVLASYGAGLSPPDRRLREQERAHRLWDEALDRLTTVLRRKGIIEKP